MTANISNICSNVKSFIKNLFLPKFSFLSKTLFRFLIIFLFAISFGFGSYFFTALPNYTLDHHNGISEIVIPQSDLEDKNVDIIHALLFFHAADYFVYRGVPIGFQYELLKELESELGVYVDMKIETDANKIQYEMFSDNYDIVVADFSTSAFLLPLVERSIPHSYSYPVLVTGNIEDTPEKKTIYISNDFSAILFFEPNSPFAPYPVLKTNEYSTEELFEKVDNGEISYLICDYNQAITLIPFYSNVQILEKVGTQFERRWILNKKNVQLNEDINHWLLDFKKTSKYRRLLKKYFTPESALINASFASVNNGISKYDNTIKKYAQLHNFDWRFVASIIFQETKFSPGLTGKGGSFGLMQLMPVTMDYYGISENQTEEENIRVGVQHLNTIRKSFDDIENEEEKLYFIAASYNAGRGHIFDAQRLCARNEENFKKWDNVAKYLKLKTKREIVADSLVKSGYFPGTHTIKYTQQVMNRYNLYKAAYPL